MFSKGKYDLIYYDYVPDWESLDFFIETIEKKEISRDSFKQTKQA